MMDDDWIPPNLDRRQNGRCRAYFMAYEHCPGKYNPHDWALENYERFLERAIALDKKSLLPVCRPRNYDKPTLKPIRTRRRVKKEQRQSET